MCRTGAKISSLFEHETLKKKKRRKNGREPIIQTSDFSTGPLIRGARLLAPGEIHARASVSRATAARPPDRHFLPRHVASCGRARRICTSRTTHEYRSTTPASALLPSIRANRRALGRSPKRRDLPGTFLPVTQPLLVLSPSSRSHRHFHLVSSSSSPSVSLSISPRKDGPSPLRSPRYAPPFLSFQFLPRRRLPVAVVSFFPPLEISFVLKYLKEGWYRGGG